MKYEFHVGDYVETKTRTIGYVSNVSIDNLPRWTVTKVSDPDAVQSIYRVGFNYTIVVALSLINEFNRIGQYDFTKRDEGKIEPLAEEYTKSFPFYKTTTTGNDLEWCGINFGVMGKKINEIIEAVNRLEEKVNGMEQS